MKILRLRILNLNSLRGEHLIDFTEAPLVNDRLYAIVGPTGAGKTSILDAITLALYGQTERNKSETDRADGGGSVISYGEGECEAELEYETLTGKYVSTWTRQRARKKAKGKLQGSKHRIAKFDPVSGQQKILAEKKKDVKRVTEEVVGLDYERFVRSAMLTQGEFARFLKSDHGNKAAILEKITGTEIYQELGTAAFERQKTARENLERSEESLTTNPPLSEAARTELNAEAGKLETQIAGKQQQLQSCQAQLNKHERFAELAAKIKQNDADLATAKTAWTALAPKREALKKSVRLGSLRTSLEASARLATESQKLRNEITGLEQQLIAQNKLFAKGEAQLKSAREKETEFKQKLPARTKKTTEAAELERQINRLQEEARIHQGNATKLEEEGKELRKLTNQQGAKIKELTTGLGGRSANEVQQEADGLQKRIGELRTRVEDLRQWLSIRQLEERLAQLRTEKTELDKQVASFQASVKQLTQEAKASQVHLEEREEVANAYRLRLQLADHRHELKDGKPCPLCGALDHPILKEMEPVTDARMEAVKAKVVAARQRLATASNQLKEAEVRQGNSAAQGQKMAQAISQEQSNLAQLPQPKIPNSDTAETIRGTLNSQAAELSKHEATAAKLQVVLKSVPALRDLEGRLATNQQRLAKLTAEHQSLTESLNKAKRSGKELRDQVKELLGGDFTAEHCRLLLEKRDRTLAATLATATTQAAKLAGEKKAVAEKLKSVEARSSETAKALSETNQSLETGLAEMGLTQEAARAQLLAPEIEEGLRSELAQVDRRRDLLEQQAKELQTTKSGLEAELSAIPAMAKLLEEKVELEQAVNQTQQSLGGVKLRIEQDDQRQKETADKREELTKLRAEANRWARLGQLIGSADGKKFRSYAQAITLQRLVDIGNRHLERISGRYRMEYDPPSSGGKEELSMVIIDQYQNDNKRTMATLSGGESFLISLALALGLSDLASGKALIESLFIDEGFGTLDSSTLDQAMDTLESLQAQGKMIGLISHVQSLRERIRCKIVVEPVGEGFSSLRFEG